MNHLKFSTYSLSILISVTFIFFIHIKKLIEMYLRKIKLLIQSIKFIINFKLKPNIFCTEILK